MEEIIKEIGIDDEERLYIRPSSSKFPLIYREAMEVNWDPEKGALYGAKPRKWGYTEWYSQIISAAASQGSNLCLSKNTKWVNIPSQIKAQILNLITNGKNT